MVSRHALLPSLLLALVLVASSCGDSDSVPSLEGSAAAIASGDCVESTGDDVTIYSGRSENLIQPILDAFECESGVDVKVRWGSSTDLALLIDEEGSSTEADVYLSRSPGPVGFLAGKGLLGELDADTLGLVTADNQADDGSWVGFSGRRRVLVYNVDEVSADELPASVLDLTGDTYDGRVAIPATNGSFEDWFTVFRDTEGNDVATQWLDDMVDNGARAYADNRSIVDAVSRGEIDFGLVNHYYNYQEAAALGDEHRADNHGFDSDDIGGVLIITAATVLADSDSSAEANDLIAYLLSEGAQRYFADETFEYPLAAGVDANEVLPELNALEVGAIDFDSLGGGFEETQRIIEASGINNS
jgi:iron(III) transport system substrate-binding protein